MFSVKFNTRTQLWEVRYAGRAVALLSTEQAAQDYLAALNALRAA